MSLAKKGYAVYPLRQKKILIGEQVVYDRDTRGKSWFILDYAVYDAPRFIPAQSTGLVTSDGLPFHSRSRRKGG